ncbi:hypothetical protein, partial [Vibrio vulnificus]|uniref:hypothetical protein n=1 Tax=Vibrio vulnificus TaxID=672 RepID=UPI003F5A459A
IKIKDVGDTSNIFKFTCSNFHEISFFFELYNAALRGECRLNQVSADHFHHKTHRKLKMPRGMNPA